MDVIDFTEDLMQELWDRRVEATEMQAKIERLTKERDTIQSLYCVALSSEGVERPLNGVYDISVYNQAKLLAQEFGWDCFKE
jgi:hypothetical protein